MMHRSAWSRLASRLLGGCALALLLGVAASPTRAEINAGNVAASTPPLRHGVGRLSLALDPDTGRSGRSVIVIAHSGHADHPMT